MENRIVKINSEACTCCADFGDEMYCTLKSEGLALNQATGVLLQIIEWETKHLNTAPVEAYLTLYRALLRDATEENTTLYISSYESILNAISVQNGRTAAYKTFMVLQYARKACQSVLFPSDVVSLQLQAE